jgi:hypothetical protein
VLKQSVKGLFLIYFKTKAPDHAGHPHKVQSGLGCDTVRLNWETVLIANRQMDNAVIEGVAHRPDDGLDAVNL